MDIEMLKQRIRHLEAALADSNDLLTEMINDPTVGGLYRLLADAEELIGENNAVLDGEFEE
jgi:hypothetical protein